MAEKNDYQKDLMIDPDILDILWTRHPHIYLKYSEASADANDLVRKKKNDLEIIDAKLDQEIRVASEGESKKMTADAIKAAILVDERHIKALVEYNDSLYRADLCSAAVKALDHKKTALQNLVQLCLSGYFALPKIPRDLKSELKKIDKAEEEKIQEQKTEVQERAGRRIRNKEEVN
jgi:hypothetical protein